jgi:REP element-mobilizing transposase RayT
LLYHPAVKFPRNIRRGREHYDDPESVIHVTMRIHPELSTWPGEFRDELWRLATNERNLGKVEVFAACLMPDHLHVLVRPKGMDVIKWLNSFKSVTTRASWRYGNRGGLWQPGMWDRSMRSQVDLEQTATYIVGNPVTAGLVGRAEDWQWAWAWWMEEDVSGA